ncbi:unnamed protein product [Rangifer tarandus platyrhynchus]|uniref:Uncharacterized protein n=1 Tax=Rangifer tarandus platyrhynchus TaxID=3082113 RepID=A0ABN8XPW5_RANTA|nr:unnamed protein product [Rangifer tarandus platyrhynchus]
MGRRSWGGVEPRVGGRVGVWGGGGEVSENLGLGVGKAAAHERAKGQTPRLYPPARQTFLTSGAPTTTRGRYPREEPSGGLGESEKVAFMWALCPARARPVGTCHAEVRGLRKERPF